MRNPLVLTALASMIVATACSAPNGTVDDPEAVASATIALTQVPAGVGCFRVSVVGSKTQEQLFPVTAGDSSVLTVSNLPRGPATFTGAAFDAACTAITAS